MLLIDLFKQFLSGDTPVAPRAAPDALAKFEQLSPFLQHPAWEATNNGAERAGRAFRHRQAPHFQLRTQAAMAGAMKAAACWRKEIATAHPVQRHHHVQRGRTQLAPVTLDLPT